MSERAESFFHGRFQAVRPLGQGGMGIVHEVIDHATGRSLALKVLRDWTVESRAYFKREFRVLREVRHPNLIRLHELFEDEDRLFFSMDLIEGHDFLGFVGPAGLGPSKAGTGPFRARIAPSCCRRGALPDRRWGSGTSTRTVCGTR